MRHTTGDVVIFCLITAVIVLTFMGMAWSISDLNESDRQCTSLGGVYVSEKCLAIESIELN